ncbi:hypothetical protein SAMN05421736_1324 [Evansella caseinilytica]|uniref:Polymerase/histidinol phosphatase N-terminal domain-containing protein n=1 Tax=Evansella caseinilytica TaxID=1503961 RepID=A0A1H3V210_9BACI|nr:PHP domain-containing protein [Evansella caseinilytica]SDZ68109.1 hypothetical protein SAMN05421736_1324 [Evansella caseinilytica]
MTTSTKKADLHMHSTASDGVYTPKELMRKCADAGLRIVSLTDHDTTSGAKEAQHAAAAAGMTFITGIELSTRVRGASVDILGYGIDPEDKALQEKLAFHRSQRLKRMEIMVQKCREQGFDIELEDVRKYAKGDTLSRPHVAKVMVEKGYVADVKEAFDKYISQGKPCYVAKEKELEPREAAELIHQAGGIAIVAHPILYSIDDLIYEWLTDGWLDGIEVYHRDHDEAAVQRFSTIAAQAEVAGGRKVLRTGGSDFHHESFGREGEEIGTTKLPYEHAEWLLKHLQEKGKAAVQRKD